MEDEGRVSGSSDFGALLRRYRRAAGLSQEALAERARISTEGVSALERGYRRSPQRETLALLAGALALDGEQRRDFEAAAKRAGLARRGGASGTAGPWIESGGSALPFALSSFVGRETELEEIATLVRQHRLVTLTGTGGVGKTQTALQVGSALGDTTDGAVCFIALAPIGDPSFVVYTVASALGIRPAPDQPPLQSLLAYLKSKALLLILDNCEHVITEAASVTNILLSHCARVRILATSREPLKVSGEHTYRLPSLSLPAAIALFTDRASAADHNFVLTGENASIVADLCRHLDGIPLAIELAAARVSLLSVKAIAERLGDRFRILTGGERTAFPRQQTMRAAIDWSYDLLCEPEQRLFERLSVFAAGCMLAAATALYATEDVTEDDVLEVLSSLVDKSLVVADFEGNQARYRLLESFREYAREKLKARGEEHLIANRHALAYLAMQLREIEVLDRNELDNWQAAMQWALGERGDVLLGQRLAASFPASVMPIEGRQWVTLALDLVDGRTPTEVLAGLTQRKATVAFTLREYKAAVASCEDALALYREIGSWREVVRAQDMAGYALTSLGRVAEAKVLIGEALATAREMEDRRSIAWSLRCLAYASGKAGDFVAARNYLTEVLPIYESDFHEVDLAYALNDLGMYEFCAGDTELALGRATKVYEIGCAAHDTRCIASALNAMSVYLLALDRYNEAEDRAREGLDIASEHHLDVVAAYTLQHLAAISTLRPREVESDRYEAFARAARVQGFVDARLTAMGSAQLITQEWERDRVIAALRDAIGANTLADLIAGGAALTQEQAIGEVSTT
ncbi:MAG: helix-turn-helix domain-containing protein [Candidatus Cybelea sp.]